MNSLLYLQLPVSQLFDHKIKSYYSSPESDSLTHLEQQNLLRHQPCPPLVSKGYTIWTYRAVNTQQTCPETKSICQHYWQLCFSLQVRKINKVVNRLDEVTFFFLRNSYPIFNYKGGWKSNKQQSYSWATIRGTKRTIQVQMKMHQSCWCSKAISGMGGVRLDELKSLYALILKALLCGANRWWDNNIEWLKNQMESYQNRSIKVKWCLQKDSL